MPNVRLLPVLLIASVAAACAATGPRAVTPPRTSLQTPPERPRAVLFVPRGAGIAAEITDTSRLATDGEVRIRCTLPVRPSWRWSAVAYATYSFDVREVGGIALDEDVSATEEQQILPEPGGSRTVEIVLRCPDFEARLADERWLIACRVHVDVDVPIATLSSLRRRDGTSLRGTMLLGGRYECMEIAFDASAPSTVKPVHVRLRNVSGYDLPATEACARNLDTGRTSPWVTVPATPAGADVMLDLSLPERRTDWVGVEMRWVGESVSSQ